ncbi:hypothetical protein JCM10450v2_005863 [Rhodotorula kratochvilovae]
MPPKQLSKGTMGLKFMNRAIPAQPPAATSLPGTTASSAPSSARATPAPAAGASKSTTKAAARTVIHESSLLSFPLLSTLSTRASTSTSTAFTSTSATYSSMPLTAGAISGRRSYGGANVEIEKLNDPSSHQAPAASSTAESKSALKKRQKAERDAAPVSVRRSGGSTLSSAKTGKRTAALDKESSEGGKRRRTGEFDADEMTGDLQWDGGEDTVSLAGAGGAGGASKEGFARPAGFEGARSKGKGRAAAGGAAGEGHVWGKQGEMREWDEDKMGDSDEEEDGEVAFEEDTSEEDSADEVEELVVRGGAGRGKGAAQTEKVKRAEVERAIKQREETRMAVGGGAKGSKAGKKRR